jgi:hypothetical protein
VCAPAGGDISPFESEGLRTARLRRPVLPEPPRHGDPAESASCRRRDEGIWLDDHWRLSRVAGVRVLSTHVARHVQALPHISGCHIYRLGDGGAHVHVWFFARPEGPRPTPRRWPTHRSPRTAASAARRRADRERFWS